MKLGRLLGRTTKPKAESLLPPPQPTYTAPAHRVAAVLTEKWVSSLEARGSTVRPAYREAIYNFIASTVDNTGGMAVLLGWMRAIESHEPGGTGSIDFRTALLLARVYRKAARSALDAVGDKSQSVDGA